MRVRKPDILRSDSKIIWSKVPEVALFFNGMGAAIPSIEHYLNNVIGEVLKKHGGDDPVLADTLEKFIRQETEHTQMHNRFNKQLFDAGFAELKPLLKQISGEMRSVRDNHSLAFNAAYCAGFENIATFSALYLLGPGLVHFEAADPSGANLILWHVAEEFEHRSVCHDAFHAVSGNYFMRVWGLLYALVHVGNSFRRAGDVVFEVYRRGMTKAETKASKRAFRKFLFAQLRFMLPRAAQLLKPGFHPGNLAVPDSTTAALRFFERDAPVDQVFADAARHAPMPA